MRKKIFIVDDDELTLQLYDLLLEDMEGVSYKTVTGGTDALGYLDNCSEKDWPDYIFVDLNMPDMTGYDFVDAYHQRYSKNKVKSFIYVLTSSVSPRDIEKGKNYPLIQDFLSKPLTEDILNRLLKESPEQVYKL